jgi:uroporphyrinogen-III synthase
LAAYHLNADFVPATYRAEALLAEFQYAYDPRGLRVLRVRGERALTTLDDGLREAGAAVDTLLAYRLRPTRIRADVADAIARDGADAVAFTSGSSVEGFETILPDHRLHETVTAVCIGPVTAEVAERVGWQRVVVAKKSTVAGLVDRVAEILA